MNNHYDDVEVVEAEVVSDGDSQTHNEYWREQLKEELRAELRQDYLFELRKSSMRYVGRFYSLGMMIAIVISYSIHKSVFLCIVHGLLGWFYILYHLIFG